VPVERGDLAGPARGLGGQRVVGHDAIDEPEVPGGRRLETVGGQVELERTAQPELARQEPADPASGLVANFA
jgi:hypothetical protein